MLTIAGGIILAVLFFAFIGPALELAVILITSRRFWSVLFALVCAFSILAGWSMRDATIPFTIGLITGLIAFALWPKSQKVPPSGTYSVPASALDKLRSN